MRRSDRTRSRHGAPTLSPSPARVRSTIANAVLQPDELRELRLVHKALADVNRLRIVRRLAAGEATVTELVAQVGLSQPLVSWHLGRLRAAGLVTTRRSGRETLCRLLPAAFEAFSERQSAILGLAGAAARDRAAS
jgi:ArsR family transcriptional regulator, arsenate/arsenite/antimonite-responsive transcriptional repressor